MIWKPPPPPICPTCGGEMTEVWGPRKAGPVFCEVCEPSCEWCMEPLPVDPAAAAIHQAACKAAWEAETALLPTEYPDDLE